MSVSEIPAPKVAGTGTSGTTAATIAARMRALQDDMSPSADAERALLTEFQAAHTASG